ALIRSRGIRSSSGTSTGPARRSRPGSTNDAGTTNWSADRAKAGTPEDGRGEVAASRDGLPLAWAFPQAASTMTPVRGARTRPPEAGGGEVTASREGLPLAWAFPQAASTMTTVSAAQSRPGEPWRADSIAVAPTFPPTRLLPNGFEVASDRQAQSDGASASQDTGNQRQHPWEAIALKRAAATARRSGDCRRRTNGGQRGAVGGRPGNRVAQHRHGPGRGQSSSQSSTVP